MDGLRYGYRHNEKKRKWELVPAKNGLTLLGPPPKKEKNNSIINSVIVDANVLFIKQPVFFKKNITLCFNSTSMTQRILVELNVQNILHKTEVFIEDNKEEQVEFNVNSKYEVRLLIHVKGHSFISFYKWKASRKQYFIDKRINQWSGLHRFVPHIGFTTEAGDEENDYNFKPLPFLKEDEDLLSQLN